MPLANGQWVDHGSSWCAIQWPFSSKYDFVLDTIPRIEEEVQKKGAISNVFLTTGKAWRIDDIDFLFAPLTHFQVQLRYHIENSILAQGVCIYDVYVGVTWLKSTKFEERVTQNVVEKFTKWSREVLQLIEREILLASA